MLIGVVSDIHCNATALKQALAAMGRIDKLLCLGDSIFEYRFSNEVTALLRDHGADTIVGNHEEVFFGPHGERARAQDWIDASHLEWLGSRPQRMELSLAGKTIVAVHSTPWEPYGQYVYPHSPSLQKFGHVEADYVLYGHTHAAVVKRFGRALVVNPGSAGQARDGAGLSCAVLDLASGEASVIAFDPANRTQL